MNPQVKVKPDDTRARIVEAAEALFLRLGYAKTAVADIAGGTLPAVMNILLALRQRDQAGEGCHLDIAMTDGMFTFASHALATGHATGTFPGMGGARLSGGSPRYQIYPTRDGKFVCCAALEQKFWEAFTGAIGLDAAFVDDRNRDRCSYLGGALVCAGDDCLGLVER